MQFEFYKNLNSYSNFLIVFFNLSILIVLLAIILKPDPQSSLIAVYKPDIDPILSIMKIGAYPLRYGR